MNIDLNIMTLEDRVAYWSGIMDEACRKASHPLDGLFQQDVSMCNRSSNATSVEHSARFFLQGGGNFKQPRVRAIERARLKWGHAEVIA